MTSQMRYGRLRDLTLEVPIRLTDLANNHDYANFGKDMFCSLCGTSSIRRVRADLWAIRYEKSNATDGHTLFYCLDQLVLLP
jgi:hypothetical protein